MSSVLYLDPRTTIGRLLTTWMFWLVFVGTVSVRIYLDMGAVDEGRGVAVSSVTPP